MPSDRPTLAHRVIMGRHLPADESHDLMHYAPPPDMDATWQARADAYEARQRGGVDWVNVAVWAVLIVAAWLAVLTVGSLILEGVLRLWADLSSPQMLVVTGGW